MLNQSYCDGFICRQYVTAPPDIPKRGGTVRMKHLRI